MDCIPQGTKTEGRRWHTFIVKVQDGLSSQHRELHWRGQHHHRGPPEHVRGFVAQELDVGAADDEPLSGARYLQAACTCVFHNMPLQQ